MGDEPERGGVAPLPKGSTAARDGPEGESGALLPPSPEDGSADALVGAGAS